MIPHDELVAGIARWRAAQRGERIPAAVPGPPTAQVQAVTGLPPARPSGPQTARPGGPQTARPSGPQTRKGVQAVAAEVLRPSHPSGPQTQRGVPPVPPPATHRGLPAVPPPPPRRAR